MCPAGNEHCTLETATSCTLDAKLEELSGRFNSLETQVQNLIERLDSHERMVRWGKTILTFAAGIGVGAGVLNTKLISFFLSL